MTWSTKKIVGLILGIIFVLGLGLLGSFYFLITGVIKGSVPYKMSVRFIEESPAVRESLGEIKGLGWFPMGQVEVNDGHGQANMNIKVIGKKAKGRVWTYFYKQEGNWTLSDASITLPESPEALPLLPLQITSTNFHEGSAAGPLNQEKKYEKGETIYWTVVVEKIHRKGGRVSLKEGLTILDENNQVIMENPDLAFFDESIDSASVHFNNNIVISDAGKYTIKTTITDRFSNKEVVRQDGVIIIHSKTLKVTDLNYHDQDVSHSRKEEPVYKMGESVYVTFEVVGFIGKEGRISLVEDLFVVDSKGEQVLAEPGILKIDEPWQSSDILSLRNKIDVPLSGEYKLKIVMHDKNSDQEHAIENEFVIE